MTDCAAIGVLGFLGALIVCLLLFATITVSYFVGVRDAETQRKEELKGKHDDEDS